MIMTCTAVHLLGGIKIFLQGALHVFHLFYFTVNDFSSELPSVKYWKVMKFCHFSVKEGTIG